MSVVFTDIHGQRGIITERLVVTYTGVWEAAVREWATERKEEWITGDSGDADELPSRLVLNLVMLELPDVAPVVMIERDDSA